MMNLRIEAIVPEITNLARLQRNVLMIVCGFLLSSSWFGRQRPDENAESSWDDWILSVWLVWPHGRAVCRTPWQAVCCPKMINRNEPRLPRMGQIRPAVASLGHRSLDAMVRVNGSKHVARLWVVWQTLRSIGMSPTGRRKSHAAAMTFKRPME